MINTILVEALVSRRRSSFLLIQRGGLCVLCRYKATWLYVKTKSLWSTLPEVRLDWTDQFPARLQISPSSVETSLNPPYCIIVTERSSSLWNPAQRRRRRFSTESSAAEDVDDPSKVGVQRGLAGVITELWSCPATSSRDLRRWQKRSATTGGGREKTILDSFLGWHAGERRFFLFIAAQVNFLSSDSAGNYNPIRLFFTAATAPHVRDRVGHDFNLFVTWIISGGNVPWPARADRGRNFASIIIPVNAAGYPFKWRRVPDIAVH